MTCAAPFAFICSIFSGHADVPSIFEPMPKAALVQMVKAEADKQGVPRVLALSIVQVESDWNTKLRGAADERGLGQILPRTARSIGFEGNFDDLYNPEENLRWSMRYLKMAWDKSNGDPKQCSIFYNEGVGSKRKPVSCWQQWMLPARQQRYECRVLVAAEKF